MNVLIGTLWKSVVHKHSAFAPFVVPFTLAGGIMLKRIFVALLTILSIVGGTATLTACNTMEGAGQDIQRAGGALENKANENK